MELIANYLGNRSQPFRYSNSSAASVGPGTPSTPPPQSNGPIIISSNNFYSWGDLITFRYIGETYFTMMPPDGGSTSGSSAEPLHQPIGEYLLMNGCTQCHNDGGGVSQPAGPMTPIHLRYHTISIENPVTIIQDIGPEGGGIGGCTAGGDKSAETFDSNGCATHTPAIITFHSKIYRTGGDRIAKKYIVIENHTSKTINMDVYISGNIMAAGDLAAMHARHPSHSADQWYPTNERTFLLESEPLLMINLSSKDQTNRSGKALSIIMEFSPIYDQGNIPNPTEIGLEAYIEEFIDDVIETAVSNVMSEMTQETPPPAQTDQSHS